MRSISLFFLLIAATTAYYQPVKLKWATVDCHRTSLFAKGFGASQSDGSAKVTSRGKKLSKESLSKMILKRYGGTSSNDIAIATQKQIEASIDNLPQHIKLAINLYQKLQGWNIYWSKLSILQQTSVPNGDVEGASKAQIELDKIYQDHGITEIDLHNILQKFTWDASADAKFVRSITGTMPTDISERVDYACQIVGDCVRKSEYSNSRCLDVGCGFGVLISHLMKSGGLTMSQIYGVDLSPEMIRNAKLQYGSEINFEAVDFISSYHGPTTNNDDGMFDSIIFCSALHDLPDPIVALKKAESLLRSNGKIIIIHAQGAAHVDKQVASNPILVKRSLPTSDELYRFGQDCGMNLEVKPAASNTPEDVSSGYLAVLTKI